jgi:RimJ/RimL family protein N-acetyltransferase
MLPGQEVRAMMLQPQGVADHAALISSPSSGTPPKAARLAGTLTTRSGIVVRVRAIQPDDTDRLIAFHTRLSPQTITARYFCPMPVLSRERAEQLTNVDYESRMALVATTGSGDGEQIIAVVRYVHMDGTDPRDASSAEVAFVIEDRWQGQGLAAQLLYRLAAYASGHGYTALIAQTQADNTRMRNVVRYSGFPFRTTYEDGCIVMRMDITWPPSSPFVPREAVSAEPAVG